LIIHFSSNSCVRVSLRSYPNTLLRQERSPNDQRQTDRTNVHLPSNLISSHASHRAVRVYAYDGHTSSPTRDSCRLSPHPSPSLMHILPRPYRFAGSIVSIIYHPLILLIIPSTPTPTSTSTYPVLSNRSPTPSPPVPSNLINRHPSLPFPSLPFPSSARILRPVYLSPTHVIFQVENAPQSARARARARAR